MKAPFAIINLFLKEATPPNLLTAETIVGRDSRRLSLLSCRCSDPLRSWWTQAPRSFSDDDGVMISLAGWDNVFHFVGRNHLRPIFRPKQ